MNILLSPIPVFNDTQTLSLISDFTIDTIANHIKQTFILDGYLYSELALIFDVGRREFTPYQLQYHDINPSAFVTGRPSAVKKNTILTPFVISHNPHQVYDEFFMTLTHVMNAFMKSEIFSYNDSHRFRWLTLKDDMMNSFENFNERVYLVNTSKWADIEENNNHMFTVFRFFFELAPSPYGLEPQLNYGPLFNISNLHMPKDIWANMNLHERAKAIAKNM